jgi:hypothetical protein
VDGGVEGNSICMDMRDLDNGHGLSLLYQKCKEGGLNTFQTPRGWPRIAYLAIVVQYLTRMMYL